MLYCASHARNSIKVKLIPLPWASGRETSKIQQITAELWQAGAMGNVTLDSFCLGLHELYEDGDDIKHQVALIGGGDSAAFHGGQDLRLLVGGGRSVAFLWANFPNTTMSHGGRILDPLEAFWRGCRSVQCQGGQKRSKSQFLSVCN